MFNLKMAVIFDMDGVLIDCKEAHERAFCTSWNKYSVNKIDTKFHSLNLEGRNTYSKINFLQQYFNEIVDKDGIFKVKQELTYEELNVLQYSDKFVDILLCLKNKGFKLGCASNSIRKTVSLILNKLKIIDLFDVIVTNEDVVHTKPCPDIYLKAMKLLNTTPENTYILEDSDVGIEAATKSGANVLKIIDSSDVTIELIYDFITRKSRYMPWLNPDWKLRIVIPMAGDGNRFKIAGYTVSKPFIDVGGKHMFQWVLENVTSKIPELQSRIEYHVCVRHELVEQIKSIPNIYIHTIPKLTEGPACTVLSVRDILCKDSNPLLIANSDQFLEWNFDDFLMSCLNPTYDGCISTFYQPNSNDTKWSFARVDKNGYVKDVAEKKYISSNASTGLYFWKNGNKFVEFADKMILANERVNNEFYVCPIYNLLINSKLNVRIYNCKQFWGLGVPADLTYFKDNYLNK